MPKKEKEIKKKEVMTREDLALLFFPFSKKKSVRVVKLSFVLTSPCSMMCYSLSMFPCFGFHKYFLATS